MQQMQQQWQQMQMMMQMQSPQMMQMQNQQPTMSVSSPVTVAPNANTIRPISSEVQHIEPQQQPNEIIPQVSQPIVKTEPVQPVPVVPQRKFSDWDIVDLSSYKNDYSQRFVDSSGHDRPQNYIQKSDGSDVEAYPLIRSHIAQVKEYAQSVSTPAYFYKV
jgi:hypothetical protein